MDRLDKIQLNIKKDKVYIHSESNIYKTEKMVATTKFVLGIDSMLSDISGAILQYILKSNIRPRSIKIETENREFTLFLMFGIGIEGLGALDMVYYKFLSKNRLDRSNDQSVQKYLRENKEYSIYIKYYSLRLL